MNYMDRYEFWCNAGLPEDVQAELAEAVQEQRDQIIILTLSRSRMLLGRRWLLLMRNSSVLMLQL